MKILVALCFLVMVCSRPVLSLRSPVSPATPFLAIAAAVPSTATPCDSVSMANHIVRGCSDGRNISDVCCSYIYNTLGRGIDCYCAVKSEPFFGFSPLVGEGAMAALLRGCHAGKAMQDVINTACKSDPASAAASPILPEAAAPSPTLPAAAPSSPALAPTLPAAAAPSSTLPAAAAAAASSPLSTSGTATNVDRTAPTPITNGMVKGKCSVHKAALVMGWVCAGVFLVILCLVLLVKRNRTCPRCQHIEMIERIREENVARIREENVARVDDNDSIPLNAASVAVLERPKRVHLPNPKYADYYCK